MLTKKPRLLPWVLTIWAGLAVGLPAVLIVAADAADAPQGEVASWGLLGGLIGVFGGWLVGLVVWLVVNGIYGWKQVGTQFRDAYKEAKDETSSSFPDPWTEDAPPLEPTPPQPALGADRQSVTTPVGEASAPNPWIESDGHGGSYNLNPWGCCMEHYDDEGYPVHGGPGCKHPQAWQEPDR